MLETPVLWLVRDPAAGKRTVLIQDFATRQQLGVAREVARSWFSRRLIEVSETEDDSLVFSLQRRWLSSWEVRDAETNCVGRIEGRKPITIKDALDHKFAVWQEQASAFIAPDGLELCLLEASQDGTKVVFSPAVERQPFSKMLLLGAAVAPLVG